MGQRMPDIPIEYGDLDCAIWDPGKTPKYLYVRFAGIVKCPFGAKYPPNDIAFRVEQDIAAACIYSFENDNWNVSLDLNALPAPTVILLVDKPATWIYFIEHHAQPIVEGRVYHNESVACPWERGAKNGICIVTWNPQATKLLVDINMKKATDLFMELRPLDDGKLVYKFCKLQDATNIAILFEP